MIREIRLTVSRNMPLRYPDSVNYRELSSLRRFHGPMTAFQASLTGALRKSLPTRPNISYKFRYNGGASAQVVLADYLISSVLIIGNAAFSDIITRRKIIVLDWTSLYYIK